MFDGHDYDADSRILTLRFKNGATYQCEDVPAEKNEAFLYSASKGSYFNRRIKPTHVVRKVEE